MVDQFLNRDLMLDAMAQMNAHMDPESDRRRGIPDELPEGAEELTVEDYLAAFQAIRDTLKTEQQSSSGQPGFEGAKEAPPLDDVSYFSRSAIMSNLQSALEDYYEQRLPDELSGDGELGLRRSGIDAPTLTGRSLAGMDEALGDGRRLFGKFEVTDPAWVDSLLAMGYRKFREKHPFVDRPAAPHAMPDRTRVLLVADWGSGIPRAQAVAAEMRRLIEEDPDVPKQVIHLGDVYYSGWKKEYQKRFLKYWPVETGEEDRFTSWSTNGNHDMYSGGHGYYQTLLADPRFTRQEGSSFFSMGNAHWRLLGLDTAYDDHDLRDPQPEWVASEIAAADRAGQKTMLLSHHQLFSHYEGQGRKLKAKLGPLLERPAIRAWFWGHEHRCMLYEPFMNVQFSRCIGHGGVPVYVERKGPQAGKASFSYDYREDFIKRGVEQYQIFGFAALDFDGPTIRVRYINERGETHHQETIE